MKRLASWVGKLQSLRLAIGPIVSILCRAIYNVIKLAHTWFSNVTLDHFSKIKVLWWLDNLKYFSSYPIIIDNITVKIDAKVSSDASGSGYSAKSSTWRELFVLHQTYTDESICVRFKELTVSHYTDSKSVANILVKSSKILSLNILVREIFLSLKKYFNKRVTNLSPNTHSITFRVLTFSPSLWTKMSFISCFLQFLWQFQLLDFWKAFS